MNRLIEIKNRLEVIEQALNEQYPRFKSDPEITGQITHLKDYVQEERKRIQKQKARGELSEVESAFIEPAINDVYLSSLDKIRRGSKPSNSVNGYICDTSSTLSYWLHAINEFETKNQIK
ncbi:hypothetical protein [Enterobacter sp. WPR_3_1]|uniref:hypothetical protein n=1 Tax=Enterobacter sp. WPR_3_1 TaxID=1907355 RepID=UPI000EAE5205